MARGDRLRCSRGPWSNSRTGLTAPRLCRPLCRRRRSSLSVFHLLQVGNAGAQLQGKNPQERLSVRPRVLWRFVGSAGGVGEAL
jgi:hypothetical protein